MQEPTSDAAAFGACEPFQRLLTRTPVEQLDDSVHDPNEPHGRRRSDHVIDVGRSQVELIGQPGNGNRFHLQGKHLHQPLHLLLALRRLPSGRTDRLVGSGGLRWPCCPADDGAGNHTQLGRQFETNLGQGAPRLFDCAAGLHRSALCQQRSDEMLPAVGGERVRCHLSTEQMHRLDVIARSLQRRHLLIADGLDSIRPGIAHGRPQRMIGEIGEGTTADQCQRLVDGGTVAVGTLGSHHAQEVVEVGSDSAEPDAAAPGDQHFVSERLAHSVDGGTQCPLRRRSSPGVLLHEVGLHECAALAQVHQRGKNAPVLPGERHLTAIAHDPRRAKHFDSNRLRHEKPTIAQERRRWQEEDDSRRWTLRISRR